MSTHIANTSFNEARFTKKFPYLCCEPSHDTYTVGLCPMKFESQNIKFAVTFFVLQLIVILLFAWLVDYGPTVDAINPTAELSVRYAFWQDVHVMVYVGFGFLLTFTGRHSWSSVALCFMLAAFAWQWSVLCYGFWHAVHEDDFDHPIQLSIVNLITADFSAATVLVTFSAVLGKLSPLQYLLMTFIEVIFISTNEFIGAYEFSAIDFGGSMYIHTFGCYFGLALSWVLFIGNKDTNPFGHPHNYTTYNSDTFAMIGTVFLWMFWPSFNSATADGSAQLRGVINTLLAILASCCMTFTWSTLFRGKFGMPEIQNSTLAGGVAMGTCSVMMIRPWAALLIGMCAGTVSTLGFIYLTPFLERAIKLHDTAGINNLHGMPGIIGALAGIFAALHASEANYVLALYFLRWELATRLSPLNLAYPQLEKTEAPVNKPAATLAVTLGLSLASGLLTGVILRLPIFDQPKRKDQFNDPLWWDEASPPSAEGSSEDEEL